MTPPSRLLWFDEIDSRERGAQRCRAKTASTPSRWRLRSRGRLARRAPCGSGSESSLDAFRVNEADAPVERVGVRVGSDHHAHTSAPSRKREFILNEATTHTSTHPRRVHEQVLEFQLAVRQRQTGGETDDRAVGRDGDARAARGHATGRPRQLLSTFTPRWAAGISEDAAAIRGSSPALGRDATVEAGGLARRTEQMAAVGRRLRGRALRRSLRREGAIARRSCAARPDAQFTGPRSRPVG